MDKRDMLLFWIQVGSGLTGLIAAMLWFWSAVGKAPPATYDAGATMQSFLQGVSRRNKLAASFTALQVLLSTATTIITWRAQPGGDLNALQPATRTPKSATLSFDCAEDDTKPVDAEGATIDELTVDLATKQVGWKGHTTNNPTEIRQDHYADNKVDSLGPPCIDFVQATSVQIAFGLTCDVVDGKAVVNYRFPYWTLNRYTQELHYFVGHQLQETERCDKVDERKF